MLQIYLDSLRPPRVIDNLDPDDVTILQIRWGIKAFEANAVVYQDEVVRPSINNGRMYLCVLPGITGATEPTWGTTTVSGTAKFKEMPYKGFVLPDETISNSMWQCTAGATISNSSIDGCYTGITIDPVTTNLKLLALTNHIVKSTGETMTQSFRFRLKDK